ncbi:helix-turn-helix transcriptional regulator [Mycolicibacterium fluoranthenivorans]|uniref:Regulatory protein, luxR family n=1 Tax=Mycolicibacterium fluoranthenivorans TaxID=258505 RepID=A0A1G4WF49_9MYCO|nr:helix-turn-helix transcriptional regulator [Mycolicibacterium fluoranthenivorans]SCX21785.1 regulatory protein, luxR family [Mycolicibacterium fluoranthenivorans]
MSTQAGQSKPELHGRGPECARLADLIATARSGTGQAMVLRGEAGVGKTALLDCATAAATDFRTVQVSGVQSDMELAYAGLQQMCAPLMGYLDTLAAPQREALSVAFGYGAGPTPDRFLVGLAVLSLLAAADDQPLLCVIDDAQWLDQVSVQTLAFVARRLLAEKVAMVFAIRDGFSELLPGLPELVITGLSDADARELLESVMLGGIDPLVRDRIVAETRGLPLALVDVPRTATATELAGGFWIAGKRSSTAALEAGFVQRITALPTATQRLLLIAASEPVGDAALFLRAAAQLDIPIDALAPAEAAGIIEFGHRMRFHHPLMRSAAYRAAELGDRRTVHRALAEATDPHADPDRRAWHAALAATGPDDAVAAELEASAGRAQSRGGIAAAAAFLERAAVLTRDPELRGSRAISAAQAKRDAAAPEAAYELLSLAEAGPLSDLQRAQVARMRAQMDFVRSRAKSTGAPLVGAAATQLLDAARGLEGLDDDLARETYLESLTAAMYAGRLGEPGLLTEVAAAGLAAVSSLVQLERPVDLLLRGMATRVVDGPGTGSDDLRAALELWNAHAQQHAGQWLYWPFPIAQESAAHELWDDEVLERIATDTVRRAREAGALAALPPALGYRAGVHFYRGEFDSATRLIEESKTITASMGYAPVRYHTLMLAAWRGALTEAEDIIAAAATDGAARGEGRLLGLSGFSTAVLYNGLGRYDEALAEARRCCEYEDLGFYGWCLYELIEAAVHAGDRETAAAALPKFEERAGASGTDWGLGAVAAAQALLADNDAAEGAFVEAIERLERADIALHLSRARLSYGEWLRRANRRTDARKQLSAAHQLFTEMGAHGFAERARRELTVTGEKVRKQPVGSGDALTAQEGQIARLARDGLTNQEIGAQLFISTHTVEWHLRKVFVKLGITSRKQLRTLSWTG